MQRNVTTFTRAIAAAAALLASPAPNAHALFGIGDIVLDPTAAANAASQISNQVTSLANEAQGLINDAAHIANQVRQIEQQYQQIQLALTSIEDLDINSWGDFTSEVRSWQRLLRGSWRRVQLLNENTEAWFDDLYEVGQNFRDAPSNVAQVLRRNDRIEDSLDAVRGSALVGARAIQQDEVSVENIGAIANASRSAQGEKAAIQANTLMVQQMITEARRFKTVFLAAESREITSDLRDLDEDRTHADLAAHFQRDADAPYTATVAEHPRRR